MIWIMLMWSRGKFVFILAKNLQFNSIKKLKYAIIDKKFNNKYKIIRFGFVRQVAQSVCL